mmetsp:Transcript_40488/g.72729  ORF Transcript_40488/g.72729 Transcript_40488/m.72729 type:complete len:216 (+) Transcript_40488:215-862(+)
MPCPSLAPPSDCTTCARLLFSTSPDPIPTAAEMPSSQNSSVITAPPKEYSGSTGGACSGPSLELTWSCRLFVELCESSEMRTSSGRFSMLPTCERCAGLAYRLLVRLAFADIRRAESVGEYISSSTLNSGGLTVRRGERMLPWLDTSPSSSSSIRSGRRGEAKGSFGSIGRARRPPVPKGSSSSGSSRTPMPTVIQRRMSSATGVIPCQSAVKVT